MIISSTYSQDTSASSSSSSDEEPRQFDFQFDPNYDQSVPSVPHVCFAPDGPTAQSQAMMDTIESLHSAPPSSEAGSESNDTTTTTHATRYRFMSNRWSSTSRSTSTVRGQPVVISWSIVPDGTKMSSPLGEPQNDSTLRAFLTGIYGVNGYVSWIQSVLDQWSAVSGLTYIYEPNDDGAPLLFDGSYPGVAGVRGDMRISGHPIDGNAGILAYCYSPTVGDMVIDTSDNFYSTQKSYAANVIAHEAGHGFGLAHTCPMDNSKLMEPYLSTSFLGPQHDDIRGAQRYYGDKLEPNNVLSQAKSIGGIDDSSSNGISLSQLSIDDFTDKDYFSFDVQSKTNVTITLTPVGKSYLETADGSDPNVRCSNPGASQNSMTVLDLGMILYSSDGLTEIQRVNSGGAGSAEVFRGVLSPNTNYKLQVYTSTTSSSAALIVQMYSLSITATTVATTNPSASSTPTSSTTPSATRSAIPAVTPSKTPIPSMSSTRTPSRSITPSRSSSHSLSPSKVPTPTQAPPIAAQCPPPVVQPIYTTMDITDGNKVVMRCQCVPVTE